MSRAYNVIDADGHILEPLDLWEKYMDPKFRDRAPSIHMQRIGKYNPTPSLRVRPDERPLSVFTGYEFS